jgi:hypothetical protein
MPIDAYRGWRSCNASARRRRSHRRGRLVEGGMVADWAALNAAGRYSRARWPAVRRPRRSTRGAGAARAVQLTGAPLLLLVGERDDWTGAAPCVDHVKRVRAAGSGEARHLRRRRARVRLCRPLSAISPDTRKAGRRATTSRATRTSGSSPRQTAPLVSRYLQLHRPVRTSAPTPLRVQARNELDRFLLETVARGRATGGRSAGGRLRGYAQVGRSGFSRRMGAGSA